MMLSQGTWRHERMTRGENFSKFYSLKSLNVGDTWHTPQAPMCHDHVILTSSCVWIGTPNDLVMSNDHMDLGTNLKLKGMVICNDHMVHILVFNAWMIQIYEQMKWNTYLNKQKSTTKNEFRLINNKYWELFTCRIEIN